LSPDSPTTSSPTLSPVNPTTTPPTLLNRRDLIEEEEEEDDNNEEDNGNSTISSPTDSLNTSSSTIQPTDSQQSEQITGGLGAERFPLYLSTDSANPYTIFAPSNAAFALLDEETLNNFFTDDGKEGLRYILGYHLINEKSINFQKLVCGLPYKMDNGQTTLTKCDGRGKKFQVGGCNIDDDNEPEIENGNANGDNSVVHVINRVIIPPVLLEST
jgi:uncharacterized surface protein with fasciclin (FAS1) repeats